MKLIFTEQKNFTEQQVQELFLSVGWVSGQYPSRLHKALLHSPTVITVWDQNRLVGLARVIDDGELVAFLHYVLVRPEYQHKGIAGKMLQMIIEKYKDYLYIEGMPEERKNADFYKQFGFHVMADGVAMQRCNFDNKV